MDFYFPTPNGVSVISQDKQVLSCINDSGQKKMKSFKTKNKVVFWNFPFARGLQYFFLGLCAFFDSIFQTLILFNSKEKKKDKDLYFFVFLGLAIVAGVIVSEVFLGFLPAHVGYVIVDYRGNVFLRNAVILALRIVFFVLFLLALRIFPQFCDMLRFNCAVEKLQKNQKMQKKNEKSPNFLNYLIFVFFLDFIVITLSGVGFGFVFNFFFHLAIFLICMSVAFEILYVIKNIDALKFLKYVTINLVSSKPSRTHLEIVSVALTEMNILQKGRAFMENEKERPFSVVYTEVKSKLASAGISDKSDADWLLATVLGKSRSEVKLVPFVTEKQYQEIVKATERRANGESIDNIFGFTEFYGLRFDVNKKVLTPRMETEILVELVLKAEREYKNCTILDLGTGSGAIAIAIAKNCDASVTAIDISKAALATAENNAKKNDVKIEFLHSNLFDNLKRKRKFDIIVSNPPYIPTAEIEHLDKNVKECDPMLALDGGEDGLDFYRVITSQAVNRLNPNGQIFFEIGKGQASAVRKILRDNGFKEIKTVKDYNKIERIVSGKL